MSGLITSISNAVVDMGVFGWDALLTVYNLVTPNLPEGAVIQAGQPGEKGKWPPYVPPKETDSRSACPALNAMANHGILPHNGRNITFKELNEKVRSTYNFAPSFCFFVPNYSARMLHKSYGTDTFDLEDLNLHNGIEHDASLTRNDAALQPDQGKPSIPLVNGLLAFATGKDADGNPVLTPADLSRYSGARRAQAKATNSEFSLSTFHKIFGSSNSSTMLVLFGGDVRDLETLLVEERLREGWEPKLRSRMGLTLGAFNKTVLQVEFGIPKDPAVLAQLANDAEAVQSNPVEGSMVIINTGTDTGGK